MKPHAMLVGILFTTFLILSNLTAFKLCTLGNFIYPAGLIFFPVTYLFDDILTEVYGFKVSRRIIWAALLANTIIFLGTWLTTYLPPAPNWNGQESYATIYRYAPRIFIASTIAYFFGEFSNSMVMSKLKVISKGKRLWLRAIMSSIVGIGIDNIIFLHLAFLFTIPYAVLWKMIITLYAIKVAYEICAMPLTYRISNYLKKKDNIDHYDVDTTFNPFSIAV